MAGDLIQFAISAYGVRMKICVTGASGKLGRAATRELLTHGYDVVATDVNAPPVDLGVGLVLADLTDYGQTVDVLHGVEAVVHLAAIPAPDIYPPAHTFTANTAMNSNVFLAAAQLGLPFDTPPRYAPVDEDHYPYPTTTYALSKVVGETLAAHVCDWSGIPFVGLRLSNIFEPHDYVRVPTWLSDARLRRWNLWGYIDVRDAAQACRLGLEASTTGSVNVIIAAADTIMDRPSADLLREVYPDVPFSRPVREYETLLAIDRARTVLGFDPQHSWRAKE
jgi:nucleoside-diphosphate-sugar epimerase